jgi:hypothetical protein
MSSPASNAEAEFRSFMDTHRVGYGTTEEFNYRLEVFQENLNRIAELNQANPRATFAVNQFADRTPEEMKNMMGLIIPASKQGYKTATHVAPRGGDNVDWTKMWGAVKNQGQCGSCWAFSATAAFEARWALSQGSKVTTKSFAEQELVDCDTKSSGCNGGWMDYAFEYLSANGFCEESQYPYKARDQTCMASQNECQTGPTEKVYIDLPAKNEDVMLFELANGPIFVAVDASTWSFYSGGILDSCGTGLNHGVTLVQVDHDAGFAKIRNSWGGSWGDAGYIKLALGKDMCGYADVSSFPTY